MTKPINVYPESTTIAVTPQTQPPQINVSPDSGQISVTPTQEQISVSPKSVPVQIYNPAGPKGPKGDPGAGLILTGTVPTAAELPSDASPGDVYVALDSGHAWFLQSGGTWADIGPIAIPGPTGPTGPPGRNPQSNYNAPFVPPAPGSTTTLNLNEQAFWASVGGIAWVSQYLPDGTLEKIGPGYKIVAVQNNGYSLVLANLDPGSYSP